MSLDGRSRVRASGVDYAPLLRRAPMASVMAPRLAGEGTPARATRQPSPEQSLPSAAAWTAAWCRPADVAVALAVLLFLVVIANAAERPADIQALLAGRITVASALLVGAFACVWPIALSVVGVYDTTRIWSFGSALIRIFAGCTLGTVAAAVVPLMSDAGSLGLDMLPLLLGGTVAGTMGVHLVARGAAFIRRQQGEPKRIVIAGTGPRAATLWEGLKRHPLERYELVAVTDVSGAHSNTVFARTDFVEIDELESFVMHLEIDEVYVALPARSRYREIEQILRTCEHGGVHSLYLADTFSTTIARPQLNMAGNVSVVSMAVVSDDWRLMVKRAMDYVVAAISLLVLSPLFLVVALAVKLTSAGPVFFAQQRYGLNKRRFTIYKFRTMVANAESMQLALESKNEVSGPVFKIRRDPRITTFGAVLRRSSIDELPQLWNVLKGDMSLVGPRPLPLRDVFRFEHASLMRRFSVRPGLTCLWQISGRSEVDFDTWLGMDLEYIDRWSLWLDLTILLKTVPAVLRGTGAL